MNKQENEFNQKAEQVETLLSIFKEQTADPIDLRAAITLGLELHGQMLALGETNKATAIPFALAGARLLRAVQEQGEPQPDWVGVHEEQCCRYGGLWIHALLTSGEDIDTDLMHVGISLLERLKNINPEAKPWVPSLQDDLRASIAAVNRSHEPPTIAALINYHNDDDMLRWQWNEGFLDGYDRIYIWDGPYGYVSALPLFAGSEDRLDRTELGALILADPRVVYHYATWQGEAEKRIHAYTAITEDVIALHDSDEFSNVDRERLDGFWNSDSTVACQLIENIYTGGVASCNQEYPNKQLENLPRRWGIFKRSAIPAERHIDYLWLVGVEQQPLNQALLYPTPLCHTYHLTGCRSPRGQASKIAFYMALALKGDSSNTAITRLKKLVDTGSLTLSQAQQIFLRGEVCYTGIPNPDSGFYLKQRLSNPKFSDSLMARVLAHENRVGEGRYLLLNGYSCYLWLAGRETTIDLTLRLERSSEVNWICWQWLAEEAPTLLWQRCDSGTELSASLGMPQGIIGHLLLIRAASLETEVEWQGVELQTSSAQ